MAAFASKCDHVKYTGHCDFPGCDFRCATSSIIKKLKATPTYKKQTAAVVASSTRSLEEMNELANRMLITYDDWEEEDIDVLLAHGVMPWDWETDEFEAVQSEHIGGSGDVFCNSEMKRMRRMEPPTSKKPAARLKDCKNCQKPDCRLHCSKCGTAYYCSKRCQIKHWKAGHRKECTK